MAQLIKIKIKQLGLRMWLSVRPASTKPWVWLTASHTPSMVAQAKT